MVEKCPVCGKDISSAKCCDLCGFDDSCNYEAHITLGLVPIGVRSLAGMRLDYNQTRSVYVNSTPQQQPFKDGSIPSSIAAVKEAAGVDDPVREDVFPLRYDPYSRVRPVIAAGTYHTVSVKTDGTVISFGRNDDGQCNVSHWRDIVAVAAGRAHTVGLKKDGTVIAVGRNDDGQCNVRDWRDIVAIAAGHAHTAGLKKDGTVVSVGLCIGHNCNVSDWWDIVAIAADMFHTVGLKEGGTVVVDGSWIANNYNVRDWWDIAQIAIYGDYMVGLKKDGTVVHNYHEQCNVSHWRDIVAVAAGSGYTVGLKKDGTVVAVGCNGQGQCNVRDWRDIVAIAVRYAHTVGLKKDGTVVAVGLNDYGQTDADRYKIRTDRKWFGLFSKTIAAAVCLSIVFSVVALVGKLAAPSSVAPAGLNSSSVMSGSYSENIPMEDDVTKADGSDGHQQEYNPQGASDIPDVSDDTSSEESVVFDGFQEGQAEPQTQDNPPAVQDIPQIENTKPSQVIPDDTSPEGNVAFDDPQEGQAEPQTQDSPPAVQDIPQTENTKPSQNDMQAQADAYEKKQEWENTAEQYRLMCSYGYLNSSALSNKLLNLGKSAQDSHKERYDANAVAALELFQEAYRLGNMQAAYNIGLCYYDGVGVERDDTTAVQYFAEAANAGIPDGMHCLGFLGYISGHGIEKNEELGIQWLTKSYEAGNVYSAYTLGTCLQVAGHKESAFEWYLKGAQGGDVWCMESLALCYQHGWGVEKNAEQEIYWLEKFLKECSPAPWNKDELQKRLERLYEEQNG